MKFSLKESIRLLPKNALGDKIFCLVNFIYFHHRFPRKINHFNDYLFKLKISGDLNSKERIQVSDKEYVKDYIKKCVGMKYNVPTIAILKSPNEIKKFIFPKNCCIKPTHSSGKVIFLKNSRAPKKEIIDLFNDDHYARSREINYKDLKKKIIVEPIIFNSTTIEDFKFFCFKGKVKIIQVDIDRHSNHTRKLFDIKWNDLKCSMGYKYNSKPYLKPKMLKSMINIAEKLSCRFEFIRIDLYSNENKILVGEITNCHGSANEKFFPTSSEKIISEIIFN